MERIVEFIIGAVFLTCGGQLALQAFNDDIVNTFEGVLFCAMGILAGLFLCWVAIFGPPG